MLPGDFRLPKLTAKKLVLFGFLAFTGFAGSLVTLVVIAFVIPAWLGLPLSVYGFNRGPEQPIAFPHTVHVQDVGLDCTFCHRNVTVGAAATVPAVGLCMTCHKVIGDDNPEVEKLREFHAAGEPIDWVRVHRVPDFVHFVHEAHVRFFSGPKTVVEEVKDPQHIRLDEARKIKPDATIGQSFDIAPSATCSICHGDVGSMTKVRQVRPLKMGDCVDCHRDNSFVQEDEGQVRLFAPTDCATCHY